MSEREGRRREGGREGGGREGVADIYREDLAGVGGWGGKRETENGSAYALCDPLVVFLTTVGVCVCVCVCVCFVGWLAEE